MSAPDTHIAVITGLVATPADGALSRKGYNDQQMKVVLFSFSAGQELWQQTSSSSAVMQVLSGESEVSLGPDTATAIAGTWLPTPAELPHSIRTSTPPTMLLMLWSPHPPCLSCLIPRADTAWVEIPGGIRESLHI